MPKPPADPGAPALAVEALTKRFKAQEAVRGISFAVPRGQVCALLGPNGAGKTTTIHMLLGLTLPTSGSATVLGHDIVKARSKAIARTNFMASYIELPYRVTVREALRVNAELYEVAQPKAAVERMIELFGLAAMASKHYASLSSGQKTMVCLAKSLVNDPELLFLDEPTASLDPENAQAARDILRRVATEQGMTILITSHNMVEIERIADRVLIMADGRIVADDTANALRDQFGKDDLEQVFLHVAKESR